MIRRYDIELYDSSGVFQLGRNEPIEETDAASWFYRFVERVSKRDKTPPGCVFCMYDEKRQAIAEYRV